MLDEGVVQAAQDIDLCMLLGAGWPFHLGGISAYLDRTGISEAVTGSRFLPKGVASLPCVRTAVSPQPDGPAPQRRGTGPSSRSPDPPRGARPHPAARGRAPHREARRVVVSRRGSSRSPAAT